MVLKSFLYSFSSYLPVIRRHLQITSFSADIICMCTFRIFALKYGAKSTHIAVCDTRKGIFDILSSFLFCGRCYLWRSHTAPTLPDRSCFCILHWSRAVPSRHWCMARKMHQTEPPPKLSQPLQKSQAPPHWFKPSCTMRILSSLVVSLISMLFISMIFSINFFFNFQQQSPSIHSLASHVE